MLTALVVPLKVVINFTWGAVFTALVGLSVIIVGLCKALIPMNAWQRFCSRLANTLFRVWGFAMAKMFSLTQPVQWHITGAANINRHGWYMILCNHRSWVDIPVLMYLAARHQMPMPRFFLKQQLIWVPFVGLGCWALDMPFMKRYSRELLAKKPHLQGKDIATTQRSCQRFRHIPTTVINFCEGTRFTAEKHAQKNSPYRYLLTPKAGGTAFSLQAMGEQFDAILDITISYPQQQGGALVWNFLAGRLRHIDLHIETLPVTPDLIGDYANDEAFRQHFQAWLNQRWQQKDQHIEQALQRLRSKGAGT